MLNRLKKNDKKGFTLVELIVVLVILAILAALLIPALTGYIDKAKEKQIIAKTRQAVMAVQTLADEDYASDPSKLTNTWLDDTVDSKTNQVRAKELAELTKTTDVISTVTFSNGVVATLTFTDGAQTCIYTQANTPQYKVQ